MHSVILSFPLDLISFLIDEQPLKPRKFLIHVDSTLQSLLEREDTDNNMQITIEDDGPKVNPCICSCLDLSTKEVIRCFL